MRRILWQEQRGLGPTQSDFYNNDEQRLGTDDIRVLTLLQGSRGDELACTMKRIALPELHASSNTDTHRSTQEPGHNFTTLSYLWGDPTRNIQKIKCNNVEFYVTSNLYLALSDLRQPSHDIKLWIDAICIDQKNDEEKGKQVQRMGEIYSRSRKTVIWPGPENWTSRIAFRSFSAIATKARQPEGERLTHQSRGGTLSGLSFLFETLCILLFLRRPYFTRVWIIQEVALSQHVEIVCGKLNIPWSDLILGATVVLSIGVGKSGSGGLGKILLARALLPETPSDGLDDPAWVFHSIMRSKTPNSRNILAMATIFRQSHATNPVDKIFGLLGLCERIQEGSTYGIKPIYSQDEPSHRNRVYIEIARIIVESENGLQLFSSIQRRTLNRAGLRWWLSRKIGLARDFTSNLPTWVPDWSDTGVTATPLSQVLRRKNTTGSTQNHEFVNQSAISYLHSPSQNRNYVTDLPVVKGTEVASGPNSRYYDPKLWIRGYCVDEIVELGAVCNTERIQSSIRFSLTYAFTTLENHRLDILSRWEKQFRLRVSASTFWNDFMLTITCGQTDVPEETKVMSLLEDFRSRSPANLPITYRLASMTLLILPLIVSAITGSGIWERIVIYWCIPVVTISLSFYTCFQIFPNFNFHNGCSKHGLDEGFLKEHFDHMELRRMAILKSRALALVPEVCLVGDQVWICSRSPMPLILRSRRNAFEVLGECYVHQLSASGRSEESICLL